MYCGYLMLVAADRVEITMRDIIPSAFHALVGTYFEEITLSLANADYGMTFTLSQRPAAWHVFAQRGKSFVGFGFEYLRGLTCSEEDMEISRTFVEEHCAQFVPLRAGADVFERLRALVLDQG